MGIMGAGRHTGKIVCCLPPDVSVSCAWSVSGGLGALGALSASWLGLRGASGVQLLGRAGHSRRPEQDVPAQLKGAGFVTRAARCDMSCLEEVAFAVGGPGLGAERGLLHAGGLLRDAPVGLQTAGGFRAVLGPKVAGLQNFLRSTSNANLQAVKMFSSIAALLGSPGQLNYSAANGHLDFMAHQLRGAGAAAVSVQWGPWADVGMAQQHRGTQHRMERMGLHMVTPRGGLGALSAAVYSVSGASVTSAMAVGGCAAQSPVLAAMDVFWERVKDSLKKSHSPVYAALQEMLADMISVEALGIDASGRAPPEELPSGDTTAGAHATIFVMGGEQAMSAICSLSTPPHFMGAVPSR